MQSLKLIFISSLTMLSVFASAQAKIEGKIRVIINSNIIEHIQDSCILSICMGDEVIETLNLSEFRNWNNQNENNFVDIVTSEGTYYVIVGNLFTKPILIVNLEVKKKTMAWLALDYPELVSESSRLKSVVIKDAKILWDKYLLKNSPIVN